MSQTNEYENNVIVTMNEKAVRLHSCEMRPRPLPAG